MSNYSGLLDAPPGSAPPAIKRSPARFLVILAIIIFLAEIVAMVVLYNLNLADYAVVTLLDVMIMTALILPGLYFLQLKPLINQMRELDRAENSLRASESVLRKVLQTLPVGVWILDKTGQIVHGNPASLQIWAGARYVGLEGFGEYKGWWPDSGKRIQAEEWAAARAIARGETSLNEEIEIENFAGEHKFILNSAVPILDEGGAIQGAITVNQDITQRKRAQEEMIRTNELQERFFSSISTLIAYMDRDFNFIRVNDTYARSAGHPPEYFIGRNHFELYPHAENLTIFKRVVETGEAYSVLEKPFEYPEYPDRGVTYWDWSLQPVKAVDGKVEGVVLSLVNVSERKLAQIQLARQNQELRALSEVEHGQRELAESLVQSVKVLSSSLQLENVLNTILDQIRRNVPFRGADIVLIEGKTFHVAGFRGFEDLPDSLAAMQRSYSIDGFPHIQRLCATLQPVLVPDTLEEADWRLAAGMEWVRSYLAVPLIRDGQVIGILNLSSDQPGFFNLENNERLLAFADHAALALHNAQMYKAELTARQVAETLSAAAQALTQTLDLDAIIDTLLTHLEAIIHSEITGIALLEGEARLAVRGVRGDLPWFDADQILSMIFDIDTSPLLQSLTSARKSILVSDTDTHPIWQVLSGLEPIHSWLGVPLIASDKVIGVIGMGKSEKDTFTLEEIQWAEALVGQAAMAIQNAWLFEQVRYNSVRLQSLARKLVEIQESERYTIARELHDEAGQSLSSMKLHLRQLEQDPDCPSHVRQRIQELKDIADNVLEELHRLAMDLRPVALDRLGLVAALEQLTHDMNTDWLSIRFKAVGFAGERLPKDLEIALYRIVQEALTNVVRHAHANSIGILLEHSDGHVKVFVEDDGIGFDSELHKEQDRLGLVGMHERAEMFGGSLTVESSSGKGTSIIVEVPVGHSSPNRG